MITEILFATAVAVSSTPLAVAKTMILIMETIQEFVRLALLQPKTLTVHVQMKKILFIRVS